MYVQSAGVRYNRELQMNLFLRYRSSELLCEVKSLLFDVCGYRNNFTNLMKIPVDLIAKISLGEWGEIITSWPSKIKRFCSFSDLLLCQKL